MSVVVCVTQEVGAMRFFGGTAQYTAYGRIHAVSEEAIQAASERWGIARGGVTVSAMCGANVIPSNSEFASFRFDRCQRCERSFEKATA
jgi:hypothetical protein